MLQLPQRLRLDLADALSRHRELLAGFFQRVVGVHADAEAQAGREPPIGMIAAVLAGLPKK
jgi:hypothetical protein